MLWTNSITKVLSTTIYLSFSALTLLVGQQKGHMAWNQLPSSLRQPHSSPSVSDLPAHAQLPVNSPMSPSITPLSSLTAQDLPLSQIFPTTDSLPGLRADSTDLWLDHFFWASLHFVFSFSWGSNRFEYRIRIESDLDCSDPHSPRPCGRL